jgi:MFS family permease
MIDTLRPVMPRPTSAYLDPYRRVLAVPGGAGFSLAGLVARMSLPMTGLGIVLLMQARTGEYAVGGSVSAVYTIAAACATVTQGRLLDRLGQRRVLPVCSALFAAALVLLAVGQVRLWPLALAYLAAVVAGVSSPAVGSAVRARWSYVIDDPAVLPTAYAVESINDEIVFQIGPLLCTFLATVWHSWAGVGTAAVLSLVGTLAFVAQTGSEPPAGVHDETGPRPRLPWRTIAPLLVVCTGMGILFGTGEVTTVGFAAEHGHRSLAGVPLAVWSFGSMVGGIVAGATGHRRALETRVRVSAATLLVTALLLPFMPSIPALCGAMALAGFAISPTIVATVSLAEAVLPRRRLTEGLSVLFTGMNGGAAVAAAAAGVVIDHRGASTAYWLAVVAGATALVAALLLPRGAHSTTVE